MSSSYEQVEFTSAADCGAWLEQNHARVRGIWAVTYKKGAGERHLTYEALVREALCFGWIDGQARGIDEFRTSLLLTPRRPGSGWSRPNKIRIAELEAAGLLAPAGIAAIEAAKASGSWTLLDTRRGRDRAARTHGPPWTPTRRLGGTGTPFRGRPDAPRWSGSPRPSVRRPARTGSPRSLSSPRSNIRPR